MKTTQNNKKYDTMPGGRGRSVVSEFVLVLFVVAFFIVLFVFAPLLALLFWFFLLFHCVF